MKKRTRFPFRAVALTMALLLGVNVPICADTAELPTFTVTDAAYGAMGDGITNDRAAIQAAIDAASAAGGGIVLLPAGKTFLTGNIILKSNVTLQFSEGAILKQSTDRTAYVKPTADGYEPYEPVLDHDYSTVRWGHSFYFNYPFIYAGEGTKNVAITGKGIIDMTPAETCAETLHICPIGFYRTENFEISDVTIQNFSSYAIMPYTCKNGLISGITVKDYACYEKSGINCDGISMMNCQDMRVTGCNISAGDDALYIFTSYNDPRGGTWWNSTVPQPSKNFEIDNNTCTTPCKAFAFILWGAHYPDLTQVEVSNVYVHDNTFSSMGIWNSDPYVSGYGPTPVKNVRFENNTISKIQDNFYSTPITNMVGYPNMPTLKNADFSQSTAYWTTDNATVADGVAALTDGSVFEGLSLSAAQNYIFSAKVQGNGSLVVKNLENGAVIKAADFAAETATAATLSFIPPKSGNYLLGVTGTATVDDIDLTYDKNRQTIFTEQYPTTYSNGKGTVHDLGTRFSSTTSGKITAVRIYTSANETGVHTVRLWDYATGTVIAGPYDWTVTDGLEGWQEFTLPEPLLITAGKDYMVSVTTGPDTNYAATQYGFNEPVNNKHLVTYVTSGYYTSTPGVMPFAKYRNTNYYRDVVFVSDEQNILTDEIPGGAKNDSRYALGTRFSANKNGYVTKARIYTSANESGIHTVKLWDYATQKVIAGPYDWTVTSGVEGWQEFIFPEPIAITANTDYVIDVSNSTDKYYSTCTGVAAYTAPICNRDLVTYVNSGLYSTNLNNMPSRYYGSANYFRDIAFIAEQADATVDKSALKELIDSYHNAENNSYTDETWTEFQAIVAAAKAVLDNEDATQIEVNSAVANVKNGFNALKPLSPLNGQTMLFTGDSIAAGAKDTASLSGWCGRIAAQYSMANGGLAAGNNVTVSNAQTQIRNQISLYSALHYDYVILQGGTSDAGANVPLGAVSDSFNMEDFDESTFAGALEALIATAVRYYPESRIGYISPYQCPSATTGSISDMSEYVAIAKAVCQKWNVSCLDLYNDAAVTAKLTYHTDNIHLNAAGYEATYPTVAAWMEALSPYSTVAPGEHDQHIIACVGDSITMGEMSSDVNRYSYPAQLQTLLGDDYKVLNLGWSGATVNAASGNSYFKKVQYRRSLECDADSVIVMLGTNDARIIWDSDDHAASKAKFKRELTLLVNKYLALPTEPTVYLATPAWALNGSAGQDTVFANGMLDAIREVAAELGCTVIDINTPTQNKTELYSENGTNLHPNDDGYRYITELMYAGLTGNEAAWPETDRSTEETNPAMPLIRNYANYPDADAYRLETVEDVQIFGDLIAAGNTFAGKTVHLMNDLDFTGIDFIPLGASTGMKGSARAPLYDRCFQGIFDGNYHTFSNVNISSMWYGTALFPVTYGAEIRNFGIASGYIEGFDVVSSIVGYGDYGTKLTNVWSAADVYAANFSGIQGSGGIASNMRLGGNGIGNAAENSAMTNVAYYGTISGSGYVAGICAWGQDQLKATNLIFAGKLDLRNAGQSITFIRYNATVALATNLFAIEGNVGNKTYISATPTLLSATDFADGTAAAQLNALENSSWIVRDAKTVPGATLLGDLDQNGVLDSADVVLLLKQINNGSATADINGDGKVSLADALCLLKKVSA